jgi:hypothetical protein
MRAEFIFEIDQRVKTPFGDVGIVNMAALNDDKKQCYFIKRDVESKWFKETELESA